MPAMRNYTVTIESEVRVRAETPAEAAAIASAANRFGQDEHNQAKGKSHSMLGDTTSKLEIVHVSVRKDF